MSRYLGSELEGELWQLLCQGAAFRGGGKAVPVISVDPDGTPHVAVVSCVVAVSPTAVRVPIGAASASLQNLQRSRRATVIVAEPGSLFYIKGTVQPGAPALKCHPPLVAVSLQVDSVWSDSERLYRMESGITYSYREREVELRRLEQAIIDELAGPL